jgi:hypothetical protein
MPPVPPVREPHAKGDAPNGGAPTERRDFRRLYEDAEAGMAQAMERLVARPSFGVLLAQMSENVLALSRIASDSADLALSNLRIAGRRDVVRLERQLGRTEDKLETVLQELEGLRDELAEGRRRTDDAPEGVPPRNGTGLT